MFNIVKSSSLECPEVLFSPLYFTGVHFKLLPSSATHLGKGELP